VTSHCPDGMIVLGNLGGRVVMTSYPSVDPTVAPGVDAPVGSLYLRDTGTAATQLYTKIGAATTDWAALGGGSGGGVVNELWGPRTAPHPADDEFDQNALDASWLQTGFGGVLNFGTRPAPYVNPGDNPASWENLRDPDNTTDPTQNSWLRIQPGNGPAGLWKRIDSADFGGAVPSDLLCWARFRFAWRNATGVGAADNDCGISFFEESGAGFSFAVHATINLNNTQEGAVGNVIKPLFWGRNGGVITPLTEGTRQNNAVDNRSDYAFYSGYVGLQKNGADTYMAWILDDGGRLFMGAYNDAGLAGINAVALWCRGNGSAMGVPLFDFDFIRFYEGVDWIP
jgi:hypothetical protein